MEATSNRNVSNHDYQYQIVDNFASERRSLGCWTAPSVKIVQMCALGIAIPLICIVLPVYARTVLYGKVLVPISASEMKLLNGSMSTVWCKGQKLNMDTEFDAYLMEDKPNLIPKAQKLSMLRHFELDDDLKEYWGFYLLPDSQVTAIMCASHLGANVMLVKGMDHLKFCAYVGSESSEEIDTDSISSHNQSQHETTAPDQPYDFEWPYLRSRKRLLHRIAKVHVVQNEQSNNSASTVLNSSNKLIKSLSGLEPKLDGNATEYASNHVKKSGKGSKHDFARTLTEDVTANEDGAFEEGQSDPVVTSREENRRRSSESISSTSSSEEAMRQCKGVLLSQPLIPGGSCISSAESPNSITYDIKEADYYYFVFASGNELVSNQISVQFSLHKSIYNVSGALSTCHSSTNCSFPLTFASNERVIISMRDPGESETTGNYSNQIFTIQSTCDPRTPLYLVFGLSLPLIVILWALR